jgi:hypothetical protein
LCAAQPCRLTDVRKASRARVTIDPMVSPLLFAYARNARTVLGVSFNVMGTVDSIALDWPFQIAGRLEVLKRFPE